MNRMMLLLAKTNCLLKNLTKTCPLLWPINFLRLWKTHGVNPSLTQQRDAINTLIGDHVQNKLTNLGELVAQSDNFNSFFKSEDGRIRAKAIRSGIEQMLRIQNPNSQIKYNDRGLFVNGDRVEESVIQQFMASMYETAGITGSALAGAIVGRTIGAGLRGPGGLALFGAGIAAGGAGAYSDKVKTMDALDEFIKEDYSRLVIADDILEYAAVDAIAYGVGKVGAIAGRGIAKAMGIGNVKMTNQEIVDILAQETGVSEETLLKRANDFIETRIRDGQEGTTQVMKHGFFGRKKGAGYDPVKYRKLDSADKIFLYLIHTDPKGSGILKSVFDKFPTIEKNMILNSAAYRGKQVKDQLKSFAHIDDATYVEIRDKLAAHQRSLFDQLSETYGGPDLKFTELEQLLLKTPTGVIDGRLHTNIMQAIKANSKDGSISQRKLVDVYRQFRNEASRSTKNQETIDIFKNYLGDNIGGDKVGGIGKDRFLKLLDQEAEYEEIIETSILKAFKNPDLQADEAIRLFQDYNSGITGKVQYRKILDIVGEKNATKIEGAIIDFNLIKNSVQLNRESTDTVIDFVGLSRSLQGFNPITDKSKDMMLFINEQAKVFKNDFNIVRMFSADLNLNPTSGASIATTVIGKLQVEIASRTLELMKAYTPGVTNVYKTARFFRKAALSHFHDNPLNQKNYHELVETLKELEALKAQGLRQQ